jgi:hypothetical protein
LSSHIRVGYDRSRLYNFGAVKAIGTEFAKEEGTLFTTLVNSTHLQTIPVQFSYTDTEQLEHQLDDFFSFTERPLLLQCRDRFKTMYQDGDWPKMSKKQRRHRLELWVDQLDQTDDEQRLYAAQSLLYLSLGAFDTAEQSRDDRLEAIAEENRFLCDMSMIRHYDQLLRHGFESLRKVSAGQISSTQAKSYVLEIDIALSLLFCYINANRLDDRVLGELLEVDPIDFLLQMVDYLNHAEVHSDFPLKKLLLVLWKVMSAMFGSLGQLPKMREMKRELYGLKKAVAPTGKLSFSFKTDDFC